MTATTHSEAVLSDRVLLDAGVSSAKNAEAKAFEGGLKGRLAETRVNGSINPARVHEAFHASLTEGLAGLPQDVAGDTLARRVGFLSSWGQDLRAHMLPELVQAELDGNDELLRSWGENIRKNAKLQKKAAFLNMIKAARLKAEKTARAFVSGHISSDPDPGSSNRPALPHRAPNSSAAHIRNLGATSDVGARFSAGVEGAFHFDPAAGFNARNPDMSKVGGRT